MQTEFFGEEEMHRNMKVMDVINDDFNDRITS